MESTSHDIEEMTRAKNNLESIPATERNAEYCAILAAISKYLDTYCEHHIVQDMIDTHEDYSITIDYCDKCHKTF